MSLTDTLQPARIAHVLFADIVAFTTLPHREQVAALERLKTATGNSVTLQSAVAMSRVTVLPTGDGMALVFEGDISGPARCALEITHALASTPTPAIRMGIHSGLVQSHLDVGGNENLVGEGLNTAHRVMECAAPGQILLSGEHARWLRDLANWSEQLIEVGQATVKHGVRLEIYVLTESITKQPSTPVAVEAPAASVPASTAVSSSPEEGADVVLLFRRNARPDEEVLAVLERELAARGLTVYRDRETRTGVASLQEQERHLRTARAVVPIISPRALRSEMLQYALETVLEERQKRGAPAVLPIQVGSPETDEEDDLAIRDLISPFSYLRWDNTTDDPRLVAEIMSALREPVAPREIPLEVVGGGMNPESPFYIERSADTTFLSLLDQQHSIVLVRGGRQIGKTSLLARGIQHVRLRGGRSVRTDFQKLSSASLQSAPIFYRQLASSLVRQTRFSYDFALLWDDAGDPGQNFEYFLRDLLESEDAPLTWFLDEADKMFSASFASDFFGLIRTWHNDRAAEPDGPLHRLTVVIAYATEAHLFISDLNQSPFNVGERVPLEDFTPEQVLRLNELYAGPIRSRADLDRLYTLLNGQPYLTRRALDALAREQESIETLLRDATRDDGPFSDHLKRVLASVSALDEVVRLVLAVLDGEATLAAYQDAFYRLLRAGVIRQERNGTITFRCSLYATYLQQHLPR